MGWGSSFKAAVSSVTRAVTKPVAKVTTGASKVAKSTAVKTYGLGTRGVVGMEKLASNPTTAKVMPLQALMTGKGRENLMAGPYAKIAGPMAAMLAGPAAGALVTGATGSMDANGEGDLAGLFDGIFGGGGGGQQDRYADTVSGGGGGGGASYYPEPASSGGFPVWGWVAIVGGGILVLFFVFTKAFKR